MVEATAVTGEVTDFKHNPAFEGMDYHSLNAMLNLYDADGNIQFDADKRAAQEYFLQHVNQNTVFFHSLRERLDYLVEKKEYYEGAVVEGTRSSSSSSSTISRTARSSASRPSSAPSSTTPATR